MGKKTTTTSEAEPWKPAQGALKSVMSDAANLYADGGMRVDPYTGQRVATASAETMQGAQGMATPSNLTAPTEAALTSYLDGSKFDAMRQTIGDDIQSRYGSMFSGGQTDNPLVQQHIARGAAEGMAGAEYDAGLQALGMAPTIAGMGRADAAGAVQGGSIIDNFNQRELDAQMAQHYEGQSTELDALKRYAGIATGIGSMGGMQTNTEPYDWGKLMGDIGSAAYGVSFLSDRRLKTDIVLVEEREGFDLFEYRYLWDAPGTVRRGYMAQDVLKVIPEAVRRVGAYLALDYSMLPEVR